MKINNQKQKNSFERNILIQNVNRPGINRTRIVEEFLEKIENRPINKIEGLIRNFLKKEKPKQSRRIIVQIGNSQDFLSVDKKTSLGKMLVTIRDYLLYSTQNGKNNDTQKLYDDALDIVLKDKKTKKINYSDKK